MLYVVLEEYFVEWYKDVEDYKPERSILAICYSVDDAKDAIKRKQEGLRSLCDFNKFSIAEQKDLFELELRNLDLDYREYEGIYKYDILEADLTLKIREEWEWS